MSRSKLRPFAQQLLLVVCPRQAEEKARGHVCSTSGTDYLCTDVKCLYASVTAALWSWCNAVFSGTRVNALRTLAYAPVPHKAGAFCCAHILRMRTFVSPRSRAQLLVCRALHCITRHHVVLHSTRVHALQVLSPSLLSPQ